MLNYQRDGCAPRWLTMGAHALHDAVRPWSRSAQHASHVTAEGVTQLLPKKAAACSWWAGDTQQRAHATLRGGPPALA